MASPPPGETLSICKHPRRLGVLCCALFVLGIPAAARAAHSLATAVEQPNASSSELDMAYSRIKGTGAKYVRIVLYWSTVQPSRPAAGTNAGNPSNASYDWAQSDVRVNRALAAGLAPIITVWRAPRWAEDRSVYGGEPGTVKPSAAAFGHLAVALAKHYPRVHKWEVWNEPNLDHFLTPQIVGGKVYSPRMYRGLLNAFTAGIHHVDRHATVAAGSLARRYRVAPLRFMRGLFCLDDNLKPRGRCVVSHLDAWSHHPYTDGGPFDKQGFKDGVSLGDLPRMRRTLHAAIAAHRVATTHRSVAFWVSEFSWDTDAPDPKAVPENLHARWVSEALYQAWRSGVTLFVWHQLRDRPFPATQYQSGLYFCGNPSVSDDDSKSSSYCGDGHMLSRDAAKTDSIVAFRFPFVIYRVNGHLKLWGRTPYSNARKVLIERKTSSGWSRQKTASAGANGIFTRRWPSSRRDGIYRARLAGTTTSSREFSLRRPADLRLNTWGCGGSIPC